MIPTVSKESFEEMIKGYRWAGVNYPPKQIVTEKLIAKKAFEMSQQYAKEIAIGFNNWKIERHKEQIKNIGWLIPEPTRIEDVEQMFNQYIKSITNE